MDTSETYIKMCKKAEEIQALAPSRYGWSEETIPSLFRDHIWLPRQDQLQEMIEEHNKRQRPEFEKTHREAQTAVILREIVKFNNNKYHESMEQLWLAFVMKEKYNNIWNGEDWTNVTARKDS